LPRKEVPPSAPFNQSIEYKLYEPLLPFPPPDAV
jgi:hypothetical protein